ncbi:MAG TPA: anti-sigma factor, partial [bacterium]|nr:anti-sigma factor [bacterium]
MEIVWERDKCTEYRELFGQYLYGELPEDERERVESHLRTCPPCQQEIQEYQRVLDLLDNEARQEPATLPEGYLSARLRKAQIPRAVTPLRQRRRRLFYVAGMAASFVMGVVAASFWTQSAPRVSPSALSSMFGT